jgi:tetratricopeptide (TPR) repeat protein
MNALITKIIALHKFPIIKLSLILLLFCILTFWLYANTFESPFIFDDTKQIRENPHIRLTQLSLKDLTAAGFKSSRARPIAFISFALNYYFHQYDPLGYHLVNISIHILAGFILFLFLKTTLTLPSINFRCQYPEVIAFLAALIWLVHPVQTQSVTYIVQRMNSLASTLFIFSFWLYLKGRLVAAGHRRWLWLAGSVLTWLVSLGCKQITVTLPFLVYLYEWYFFQNLSKDWFKRSLKYILLIFLLFAVVALIYLGLNPIEKITSLRDFANNEFTFNERVLTQFRVVIYYISLLLYPNPSRLNLDYDFPLSHSLINPVTTLLSLIVILGLLGLAVLLAKKERLISLCIIWFFGNLVIESSIIPLAIIFEHRLYLPSMLSFLIPIVIAYRYVKLGWLRISLFCVVLALFSFWTYDRNRVWESEYTLWSDSVKKSPNKARPHRGLGEALAELDKIDEAIHHYRVALQIRPDFAEAHNNLGIVLEKKGQSEVAIEHYAQALKLKPDYVKAHVNLGVAFAREGKVDEAITSYRNALSLNPNFAEAHTNLGAALAELGNVKEAILHYTTALRLNPDVEQTHNNLGVAFMQNGKIDSAIDHFQKALQINPEFSEGKQNLIKALAINRELQHEIARVLRESEQDPENPTLRYQLGILFFNAGEWDKAIFHLKRAISLQPGFARAQNDLANIYAKKEEYEKALIHLKKTLEYWPDNAGTYYNIACMYSRLGKLENSMDWLKKAVDRGYNNWRRIKTDSDLENLRKTPYYEEFVKGR